MSEIRTLFSLDFGHPYVSKNQTLSSDFRQCLKSKNVWKPSSYWVSEIHTSLDFRHLLHIKGTQIEIRMTGIQICFWLKDFLNSINQTMSQTTSMYLNITDCRSDHANFNEVSKMCIYWNPNKFGIQTPKGCLVFKQSGLWTKSTSLDC